MMRLTLLVNSLVLSLLYYAFLLLIQGTNVIIRLHVHVILLFCPYYAILIITLHEDRTLEPVVLKEEQLWQPILGICLNTWIKSKCNVTTILLLFCNTVALHTFHRSPTKNYLTYLWKESFTL